MISLEDFEKVDVRVGTVLDVKENKKSRNPAYVLSIDFGEALGVKKSSAQITALYMPQESGGAAGFVLRQPRAAAYRLSKK